MNEGTLKEIRANIAAAEKTLKEIKSDLDRARQAGIDVTKQLERYNAETVRLNRLKAVYSK